MNLPMLTHDKANHVLYGGSIFSVVSAICVIAMGHPSGLLSMCAVALFAVGKELADRRNPDRHTADIMDCIATIAGGGAMWLMLYMGTTL